MSDVGSFSLASDGGARVPGGNSAIGASISDHIRSFAAQWFPNVTDRVHVFDSAQDIPAGVLDKMADSADVVLDNTARAFYVDGKTYFIADRIKSPKEAEAAVMHEVLGHLSQRMLSDQSVVSAMIGIAQAVGSVGGLVSLGEKFNPQFRQAYSRVIEQAQSGDPVGLLKLADEVVGAFAESHAPETVLTPGLRQRLQIWKGAVTNWLRTNVPALGSKLQFGNADLAYIVERGRKALERGVLFSNDIKDMEALSSTVDSTGGADGAPDGAVTPALHKARIYIGKGRYVSIHDTAQSAVQSRLVDRTVQFARQEWGKLERAWASGGLQGVARGVTEGERWRAIRIALQNSHFDADILQKKARAFFEQTSVGAIDTALRAASVASDAVFGDDPNASLKDAPAELRADAKKFLRNIQEHYLLRADTRRYYDIADVHALANGRVDNWFKRNVVGIRNRLYEQVRDIAKAYNIRTDEALQNLSAYMYALHAAERNEIMYYMKGKLSKPYDIERVAIIEQVKQSQISPEEGLKRIKQLHEDDALVNAGEDAVSDGLFDPSNKSHALSGMTNQEAENVIKFYRERGMEHDYAVAAGLVRAIIDRKMEMDRQSGILSKPGERVIAMYGFQNYVPLKNFTKTDDPIGDFDLEIYAGSNKQYMQKLAEGRKELADNVVAQVLADASSAANNWVKIYVQDAAIQNVLAAAVSEEFNTTTDGAWEAKSIDMAIPLDDFLRRLNRGGVAENDIVRYQDDGSVTHIKLKNERGQLAVHGRQSDVPWLRPVEAFTSFIASMHTFWRPAFWPMNMWRDYFNAGITLAAEVDKTALKDLGAHLALNKIPAYIKYLHAHNTGQRRVMDELAAQDPAIEALQNYLRNGGQVSFARSVQARKELQVVAKEFAANPGGDARRMYEALHNWVASINDMTDLMVRVATAEYLKNEKGWEPQRAYAYAKKLANFEERGQYGTILGGLFMFFRAGATGGFRALDALLEGENGPQVAAVLFGLGASLYLLSYSTSGYDDEGKRLIEKDDMNRWVRGARFYGILGDNNAVQVPFPLGIGGAIAAGAQMMAVMMGHQSLGDAATNVGQIAVDNLSPIAPSDAPGVAGFVDTATPTAVRGLVQLAMNLNGLGIPIDNAGWATDPVQSIAGRKGTAGSPAEKIAQAIASATGIDVDVESIAHLMNFYTHGVSDLLNMANEAGALVRDPGDAAQVDLRKAIPFIAGFVSPIAQRDAFRFYRIREKTKALHDRLKLYQQLGLQRQVDDLLSDYPSLESDYRMVQAVNRELRPMRKAKRDAIRDITKPTLERRKQINNAEQLMRQRMSQIVGDDRFSAYE